MVVLHFNALAFGVIRICNRLVFYVRGATFIRVIAAASEIVIFGFEQQHTPYIGPHFVVNFVSNFAITWLIKRKNDDEDEEVEVDDDDDDDDGVEEVDGDLCLGGQSYEGVVEERGVGKVGFLTTPETLASSSSSSSISQRTKSQIMFWDFVRLIIIIIIIYPMMRKTMII